MNARDEVHQLALMLRERNAIDRRAADILGRSAQRGHLGEYIAARVFDIELHESATHAGSDGRFRSGPLQGQEVNIKFYGAQEGLLDVKATQAPAWYLVLCGHKRSAASSRYPSGEVAGVAVDTAQAEMLDGLGTQGIA